MLHLNTEKPKSPRVGLFVAVVVVGMMAIRIIQSQFQLTTKFQPPGPSRGDLSLTDSDLPEMLGEWSKTQFIPPKSPEDLPDGQWWWTHAWHYSRGQYNSIVAFDQADWQSWHELTICYEAGGWELTERTVHHNAESEFPDWGYVTAVFQRNGRERAILLFSEFYEDASATTPGATDLLKTEYDTNIADRFRNRIGNQTARNSAVLHDRVLQCQVFVPYKTAMDEQTIQHISSLHLQSRELFRRVWMKQNLENKDGAATQQTASER